MTIVIDDSELDTPLFSPVCTFCKHARDGLRNCDAFPGEGRIPLAIWHGKNDHRQPYSGDHGILFEPLGPAS